MKAASLYWHVRDRDELLDLLAAALLAEVQPPGPPGDWRQAALAVCGALERVTDAPAGRRPGLLDAPEIVERSVVHGALSRDPLRCWFIEAGGLPDRDHDVGRGSVRVATTAGSKRRPMPGARFCSRSTPAPVASPCGPVSLV